MSPTPSASVFNNLALRQFAAFVVVGLAATATHAVAALTAHEHLHYAPLSANLFGYVCAFMISYLGNARLTFKRPAMHGPQFVRFMTISLATLALNQTTVFILADLLKWPFALALAPTVVLVPIFSFGASKIWAFGDSRYKAGK